MFLAQTEESKFFFCLLTVHFALKGDVGILYAHGAMIWTFYYKKVDWNCSETKLIAVWLERFQGPLTKYISHLVALVSSWLPSELLFSHSAGQRDRQFFLSGHEYRTRIGHLQRHQYFSEIPLHPEPRQLLSDGQLSFVVNGSSEAAVDVLFRCNC